MPNSAKSNVISRSIFSSINEVPENDWNLIENDRNIYLSIDYLSSLESEMNNEIDFYYVVSYDSNNKPILISSFQLLPCGGCLNRKKRKSRKNEENPNKRSPLCARTFVWCWT